MLECLELVFEPLFVLYRELLDKFIDPNGGGHWPPLTPESATVCCMLNALFNVYCIQPGDRSANLGRQQLCGLAFQDIQNLDDLIW